MGKKATFIKSRLSEIRSKRIQRDRTSEQRRTIRRGADKSKFLIQKVLLATPLPSTEDQVLLLSQMSQACRLPGASACLMKLISRWADDADNTSNRKHLVDVAHRLLELRDSQDVNFAELLNDEYATRVFACLLSALAKTEDETTIGQVADAVLPIFAASPQRLRHHVGCRVVSALGTHGGAKVASRILDLFRTSFSSSDDVLSLVRDRHTASIITRLLTALPAETSHWISLSLKLILNEDEPQKKKSRKETSKDSTLAPEELTALLRDLIENPISSPIAHQLVSDENRWTIFSALGFANLVTSKRLSRFLIALLTVESTVPTPLATKLLDAILFGEGGFTSMLADGAFDSSTNFVVQRVLALIPLAHERSVIFHKCALDMFRNRILDMLSHPIAVHVVLALIDVTARLADKTRMKALCEDIVNPDNVVNMIRDRNASLVVRKLIESHCGSSFLLNTIEQHIEALMYDASGNLIVQQLLRSAGQPSASTFYRKHLKGAALIAAAQHPCASHVVDALLDTVDPPTFAEICGALKPQAVTLAKHVNGRFIALKMIASQRDVRDILLRQFVGLAFSRGTQVVLVELYSHLDAAAKTSLTNNILLPQFKEMATNPVSSIVVQKLLQSFPDFLTSVKKWVKAQGAGFLRELSQDFHGKFVAQIIGA